MKGIYNTIGAVVLSAGIAASTVTPSYGASVSETAKSYSGKVGSFVQKVANEDKDYIGDFVEKVFKGVVGGILRGVYNGGKGVKDSLSKEEGIKNLNDKVYHTFTKDGRMEYKLEKLGRQNTEMKKETDDLLARLGYQQKPKASAPSAAPRKTGLEEAMKQFKESLKDLKKG
jgi:hypothetical protein